MFNLKLKSLFRTAQATPVETQKLLVPPGYFTPMPAIDLLATARRQRCLQTLWDNSSLPKDLYQHYYLTPLRQCVSLMQQFPATENRHHAYPGGMVDYLLKTLVNTIKLSKSYMLPIGAEPEEQATQGAAWSSVIVWSAMFQTLDCLTCLHVELEDGSIWTPVLGAPDQPYRFRFLPDAQSEKVMSYSAMLAFRLMPSEALSWLSAWPDVIHSLTMYLAGFRVQSGVVATIISEATETASGIPADNVALASTATTEEFPLQPAGQPGLSPVSTTELPATSLVSAFEEDLTQTTVLPGELLLQNDTAESATDSLLALMGYAEKQTIDDQPLESSAQRSYSTGEMFVKWLRDGIAGQKIIVNEPNEQVYVIAGAVFLKTPSIFHKFMAENKANLLEQDVKGWRDIQKQFEKLGFHRRHRNGANMFQCCQQETGEVYHGYLLPAKDVYGARPVPADTPLLKIQPQGKTG